MDKNGQERTRTDKNREFQVEEKELDTILIANHPEKVSGWLVVWSQDKKRRPWACLMEKKL